MSSVVVARLTPAAPPRVNRKESRFGQRPRLVLECARMVGPVVALGTSWGRNLK